MPVLDLLAAHVTGPDYDREALRGELLRRPHDAGAAGGGIRVEKDRFFFRCRPLRALSGRTGPVSMGWKVCAVTVASSGWRARAGWERISTYGVIFVWHGARR